jgi:hypothetical protein
MKPKFKFITFLNKCQVQWLLQDIKYGSDWPATFFMQWLENARKNNFHVCKMWFSLQQYIFLLESFHIYYRKAWKFVEIYPRTACIITWEITPYRDEQYERFKLWKMKSIGVMTIITSDMRLDIPAGLSGYIFLLHMQHFLRSFKTEYLSLAMCNKVEKNYDIFHIVFGHTDQFVHHCCYITVQMGLCKYMGMVIWSQCYVYSTSIFRVQNLTPCFFNHYIMSHIILKFEISVQVLYKLLAVLHFLTDVHYRSAISLVTSIMKLYLDETLLL